MATFKHDCDCCEFIGQHADINSNLFDLYFCKNWSEYVARSGNEPQDYKSMDVDTLEFFMEANKNNADRMANDPLLAAYRLRKAKNSHSPSTGLKLGSLSPLI